MGLRTEERSGGAEEGGGQLREGIHLPPPSPPHLPRPAPRGGAGSALAAFGAALVFGLLRLGGGATGVVVSLPRLRCGGVEASEYFCHDYTIRHAARDADPEIGV